MSAIPLFTELLDGILFARPVPVSLQYFPMGGGGEYLLQALISPWWLPVPFLLFLATYFGLRWLGRYRSLTLQAALEKEADENLAKNFSDLDAKIARVNSYYAGLPRPLKEKFVKRAWAFMSSKKFDYVDIEPDENMPLLVSTAAIQLTFGLDNYRFAYFDTIHILQHDYNYPGYNVPFMGHVNREGIFLSWDNFIRGYANPSDGDNVGIHEMAHALAFVNFMAQDPASEDPEFKRRFEGFSKVARPIFNDMQAGVENFFGSYAATNYNEFWAVCVECFFEKPNVFRTQLPGLYEALKALLNQDPLLPEKVMVDRAG